MIKRYGNTRRKRSVRERDCCLIKYGAEATESRKGKKKKKRQWKVGTQAYARTFIFAET